MAARLLPALLILLTTPALGGQDPQPYAVSDPLFRSARSLENAGRWEQAAELLLRESTAPAARFLAAALLARSGNSQRALEQFELVASEPGVLAPRAAWHLARAARQQGASERTLMWLSRARTPGLAGLILLERARLARTEGRDRDGAEYLIQAMAGKLSPEEQSRTRLELVDAVMSGGDKTLALLLLSRLAWEGAPEGLRRFAAADPEAAARVARLEFLLTTSKTRLRTWHSNNRPGGEPAQWTDEALIKEAAYLTYHGRDRDTALELLSLVKAEAGTPEAMAASYLHARCLEFLDRDLDAIPLLEPLAVRTPNNPMAADVLVRLGRICLREGKPEEAETWFRKAAGYILPGEDAAEAFWMLGWTLYLGDHHQEALQVFRLLSTRYFHTLRSPWVRYGMMGLYWEARTLQALGRDSEATDLFRRLWDSAPISYYGVLARARLEELGILTEEPGPARWDRSPLELGPISELEQQILALPLELWRLGLWDEALEETAGILRQGTLGPGIASLLTSLYLRDERLTNGVRMRREFGPIQPPPWRQGARLWNRSLPVRFLDTIEASVRYPETRVPPALVAAVIRFESYFYTRQVSHAKAYGLMQLRPSTAAQVALQCLGKTGVSPRVLENESVNIQLGTIYLRELLQRHHGNVLMALASYNAGPGTHNSWLSRFSGLDSDEMVEQLTYPGTVGYIKRITGSYQGYYSLYWPRLGEHYQGLNLEKSIPSTMNPFLSERGAACEKRPDKLTPMIKSSPTKAKKARKHSRKRSR